MAQTRQQTAETLPLAQTGELNEFSTLLEREFKPRTPEALDAVQNAVRTLAEQALQDATIISTEALQSIEAMMAAIDRKLSEQTNLIIHHPEFQQLESAWRGLNYLVYHTATDEQLKIRVLNISKK